MELTKEYFDHVLKSVATKADLEDLVTKQDMKSLQIDLEGQIGGLAQMTKRGFDEVVAKLDVRRQVEELEHQMQEVRQELNLA